MTAKILDGKALSNQIKENLKTIILERKKRSWVIPHLTVILVGDNPASASYVYHKQMACKEVGIKSTLHHVPQTISENELLTLIKNCNQDDAVHGILLQLPLPHHLKQKDFMESIHPHKDVDGFHPYNMGRLALREPFLRPCTPYGVIQLLEQTQENLTGKHAVIVGASNIVGRPMALELLLKKCTVTVCHRFTSDLQKHVETADILISAMGKPGIIQTSWIKRNAIVVDVGFTKLDNGKVSGDIEFDTAKEKAAWITPVPGGVGPMTIATLLQNTLQAADSEPSSRAT